MNALKVENIRIPIPGKFDELKASQLEQIFRIKDLALEEWQARLFLFRVLVGWNLKFWWFRLWNEKFVVFLDWITLKKLVWRQKYLDADDWHELSFGFTDFLYNPNQNLTQNPYQKLWLKGRFFRGPKGRFGDLTFGEFVRADEYFLVYQITKDTKHLDKMIACMWRHGIWKREKFDFETVDKRVKILSKLSQAQKEIILTWYIGCRKIIENEFAFIYPKPDEDQKEKTTQRLGLRQISDYAKSLGKKPMDYAPTPSDDDVEKIYHANVYYVLRQINLDIRDYKKAVENGYS